MKLRGAIYLRYASARGYQYPRYFEEYLAQDRQGPDPETTRRALIRLLSHCQRSVPYYSSLISRHASHEEIERHPEDVLAALPPLDKPLIRTNFDRLTSEDLSRRRWFVNKSGGSTGEPVHLIQDQEYKDQATAVSLLCSHFAGRDVGELEVLLWGSEKDLFEGSLGWKANFFNVLSNTIYLNAFRMTPDRMRGYVAFLNRRRPRLIVAYAQAMYELARFAEDADLDVVPQQAIITSASTLYPFMRTQIESVFRCRVYNRYGSREVGGLACERPGIRGLWVAPWASYLEVVDADGRPVPPGVEGQILVTCLINHAMPLVRYRIGDRGILAATGAGPGIQVLQQVSGRIADNFRTRSGRVITGEYFIHMIGVVLNRGGLKRFQLIQRDYGDLLLRLAVRDGVSVDTAEIVEKIRAVMDPDCRVQVEEVDEILPTPSGKYLYTLSEVGSGAAGGSASEGPA